MGNAKKGNTTSKHMIRIESQMGFLWEKWFDGRKIDPAEDGEHISLRWILQTLSDQQTYTSQVVRLGERIRTCGIADAAAGAMEKCIG